MAEWWTKTSAPPSSGLMNPKPLVALKNLTVPAVMLGILSISRKNRRRPQRVPMVGGLREDRLPAIPTLLDHGVRGATAVAGLGVRGARRRSARTRRHLPGPAVVGFASGGADYVRDHPQGSGHLVSRHP